MATFNHQLSFKIDQETFERLEESATGHGESVGSYSRRLIQSILNGDNLTPPFGDKQPDSLGKVDREMLRRLAQRVEAMEGELTRLADRQFNVQQEMEDRLIQHLDQLSSSLLETLGRLLTSTCSFEKRLDAIQSIMNLISHHSVRPAEVSRQDILDAIAKSFSPTEILVAIEGMREDWIKAFGIVMLKRLGCSREDAIGWMQARLEKGEEGRRALPS